MQAVVVSANADEREYFTFALRRAGLDVSEASHLQNVSAGLRGSQPDLVLASAYQVSLASVRKEVRALRSHSEVPLIVLVENPSESEVTHLLDAGADLVLGLPVGPLLLVGYCHALLRRSRQMSPFVLPGLDLGEIALNPSTHKVRVKGKEPPHLTQLEFRLLYVLMSHRGQVLPYDAIIDRVWGYSESGSRELVRGLVSRLRAKVEPDPSSPTYIHTIAGIGYIFDLEAP